MEKQQLPNATLVLVFGILSIVGCCFWGLAIVFAIIALVLASKATTLYLENPENYSGYQNLKVGKILSYIGIALNVIMLGFIILGFIFPEMMQDMQQWAEEQQRLNS